MSLPHIPSYKSYKRFLLRGFFEVKNVYEDDSIIITIFDRDKNRIYSFHSSVKKGGIEVRSYYKNNIRHRNEQKPAVIKYKDGEIIEKRYFKEGDEITHLIKRKDIIENIKHNK